MEKTINANGCIALWELGGTYDLAHVRAAFDAVGMSNVAPHARTPLACLETALRATYGRRGVLIRPLGADGYAVVEDVPNELDLTMDRRDLQAARVNPDGTLTIREDTDREEIHSRFLAARGQIDHGALSGALCDAVVELTGMPVRARGGVYWLPAASADRWRDLSQALDALPAGNGRAALYAVTTVGDGDTVRAIVDAFVREADAEVTKTAADIGNGGKRAAAGRAARMGDLSAMADYYAAVLGASLDAVRARIDAVGAQAGAAALDAV